MRVLFWDPLFSETPICMRVGLRATEDSGSQAFVQALVGQDVRRAIVNDSMDNGPKPYVQPRSKKTHRNYGLRPS